MSIIIKDGANDTLFEVSGLQYRKGMYELYYSQNENAVKLIGIRNIHNQDPIQVPVEPNQYEVNGVVVTTILALAPPLSVVLGFDGGDGTIVETDPVFSASPANDITSDHVAYLGIAGFQNQFVTTPSFVLSVTKSVVMVTLKTGATEVELPLIAGESGRIIMIINMSGVACTIKCNTTDGNAIWDGGTLSASISLAVDAKTILMNNTENYVVIV